MNKPWLSQYPSGVPAEVNIDLYPSLVQLVDQALSTHADKDAYVFMGKRYRFSQIDAWSRAMAAYLQSLGLAAGDRVAVMLPNVPQYPVAVAGILRAGYVVVNVNPLYTPRELEHQLKDSGAQAIIILENFAATLQQVLERVPTRHIVLAAMGDLLGLVKGTLVNYVVRNKRKLVPAFSLPQAVGFKAALKQGQVRPVRPTAVGPDDVAVLQYTGGTTGVSKGAVLLTATWWPTCCRPKPGTNRRSKRSPTASRSSRCARCPCITSSPSTRTCCWPCTWAAATS